MGGIDQLFVIRFVHHSKGCTHRIGTFVGPIQSTIAVMDEFDSAAYAPLIVEMIGGMHAGTEINKSMGPYQLVVNIVLFVVL